MFMMQMMMVRLIIQVSILYYVPTRTGQQDSYNLSVGLSATWSKPLDKKAQKLCIGSSRSTNSISKQILANKRLDFELVLV